MGNTSAEHAAEIDDHPENAEQARRVNLPKSPDSVKSVISVNHGNLPSSPIIGRVDLIGIRGIFGCPVHSLLNGAFMNLGSRSKVGSMNRLLLPVLLMLLVLSGCAGASVRKSAIEPPPEKSELQLLEERLGI